MAQFTRLAVCVLDIKTCRVPKIYSVIKKTRWKKGKKKNDRFYTVVDNTTLHRTHIDIEDFHTHFQLLDKDFELTLWKKIKTAQDYAKKKRPSTKT